MASLRFVLLVVLAVGAHCRLSARVLAKHMAARFDNILETIGRTPVVKVGKLAPPGVEIFAKLEAFNPLGSVKDRLALGVIEAAERSGELQPGQTVIEASSGNTGIGLGDGVRAKRLSARDRHGRELQRRATQADAFPGRQGGADAGRRERQRNGRQGRRSSHWRTAGSSVDSSRTKRIPTSIRRPRPSKFWRTSAAIGWTIG